MKKVLLYALPGIAIVILCAVTFSIDLIERNESPNRTIPADYTIRFAGGMQIEEGQTVSITFPEGIDGITGITRTHGKDASGLLFLITTGMLAAVGISMCATGVMNYRKMRDIPG